MTLDAAEVLQITEIAQRTAAEAIRNLARGTGGANMPIPITRPCTVAGNANNGDEALIRADGDLAPVPAVNATGYALNAGQRVLAQWVPPLGVFVTNILDRASRGDWQPLWQGPGSSFTGVQGFGTYYRIGDIIHLRGRLAFGGGGSPGTKLEMNGLPWPIKTSGNGLPVYGLGHFWNGATRLPLTWVCAEGTTGGDVQGHLINAAPGAVVLGNTTTTFPIVWAAGMELSASMTYETDAA